MQIKSAKDLTVYQQAYTLAIEIFEATKRFPGEEKYSLTDQMRRASRQFAQMFERLAPPRR